MKLKKRKIKYSGDKFIVIGHSTNIGSLQIHKR